MDAPSYSKLPRKGLSPGDSRSLSRQGACRTRPSGWACREWGFRTSSCSMAHGEQTKACRRQAEPGGGRPAQEGCREEKAFAERWLPEPLSFRLYPQ